jgi:hypothetical protein
MAEVQNVEEWHRLTRMEKLANVIYAGQVPAQTRRVMNQLAAGERSRPPAPQGLLHDHQRGAVSPLGGQAVRSNKR